MREHINDLDTPIRCLLWGTGNTFRDNYHLIKYYELTSIISIIGITSNNPLHSEIGGIRFIKKHDIDISEFDIVIVFASSKQIIGEISNEALLLGVKEYNIIPCGVMNLIGFDINKYRQIKADPPTIFAPNCWGGITYHRLGLRFESPIINMFFDPDDYLVFLQKPKHYISHELVFKETGWDRNINRYYPIAWCDDILLHFNHYNSFEEAKIIWNERKKRIKWDNIFAMYYDEDSERVERFLATPYEKKVCFVPYHSEQKNVISVQYRINEEMKKKPFWEIVNGMASGVWQYYEVTALMTEQSYVAIASF